MNRRTAGLLLLYGLIFVACSGDYDKAATDTPEAELGQRPSPSAAAEAGQEGGPPRSGSGSPGDPDPETGAGAAGEPSVASPPLQSSAPSTPSDPPAYGGFSPVEGAPPASRSETPDRSGALLIRLSRGIALPQTGPTGTMMGFHVEYRFERAVPGSSEPYVLVIQRASGDPYRQPVRLASEGSLDGFVPQWRPEQGPFQAHIEDQSGRRLSRSLPLR
jgi:hypothetical protein